MSESARTRSELAALLVPLLREWALLRERERDLLLRAAEALGRMVDPGDTAGALRSPAAESAQPDAPRPPAGESAPPESPRTAMATDTSSGSSWIDQTIDAVLAGAFSVDSEEETDDPPSVDLLLMRSGETWVGIPWDRVAALGLSDDQEPVASSPLVSLRAVLAANGSGGDDAAVEEPYRLSWERTRGPCALSCEVLGGVVAAPAAAARGVSLVWLPDDSETGGRLLPLVEFLAAGWRGDRAETSGEQPASAPQSPALGISEAAPSISLPSAGLPSTGPASTVLPSTPVPVADSTGGPLVAPLPAATPVSSFVPPGPAVRPAQPDTPEGGRLPRPGLDRLTWGRGARATSRAGLVAVRYLPARVAIARALRAHGWFVLEAADPDELPSLLHRIHHTAVFAEVPDRPEPSWIHALMRARESGTRIIGVASRLRGATNDPFRAFGTLPRLLYPFQDLEVEKLIQSPEPHEHH